jgi:hypothetical protein
MQADGVIAGDRILLKLSRSLRAGAHGLANMDVVLGVVVIRRVRRRADDERSDHGNALDDNVFHGDLLFSMKVGRGRHAGRSKRTDYKLVTAQLQINSLGIRAREFVVKRPCLAGPR